MNSNTHVSMLRRKRQKIHKADECDMGSNLEFPDGKINCTAIQFNFYETKIEILTYFYVLLLHYFFIHHEIKHFLRST